MKSHSLRLRLLAGAAMWTSLALLAAGAAIVVIFSASVERDQSEDLLISLDRLIAGIDADTPLSHAGAGLSDPRYATPAGGLYWQVRELTAGAVEQSRSVWDFEFEVPAPSVSGVAERSTIAGPQHQTLAVLTEDIILDAASGERHLRLSVAEDRAIRDREIRQFSLDLAGALIVVGASLALAGWLLVDLGIRPLRRLQHSLEEIARGRIDRLSEDHPLEVLPLVREANALLDGQERSLELARTRADDLAHGLKTPLAVLSATATRLRAQGDDTNAGVLDLLSQEMADRIDYQMRLSQLRVRSGALGLSASLDQSVLRSVAVLRKTGGGETLFWKLDADRVSVNMDPHDLMELIGVILENAAKWAKTEIEITCRAAEGLAILDVSDEIAQLGPRGRRLDEGRSGSGFGIAIAREILALNGGTMTMGRSDDGGLHIMVQVPLAEKN